jgi:hypothetical protein
LLRAIISCINDPLHLLTVSGFHRTEVGLPQRSQGCFNLTTSCLHQHMTMLRSAQVKPVWQHGTCSTGV